MKEAMLTTTDNPFDPFTQYQEWYAYDMVLGYNTTNLLARVTIISNEMSEADQGLAIENAIDEIVFENVSGVHKKVFRQV